jgi:teichuronic acid biosynthesis protein TuaE
MVRKSSIAVYAIVTACFLGAGIGIDVLGFGRITPSRALLPILLLSLVLRANYVLNGPLFLRLYFLVMIFWVFWSLLSLGWTPNLANGQVKSIIFCSGAIVSLWFAADIAKRPMAENQIMHAIIVLSLIFSALSCWEFFSEVNIFEQFSLKTMGFENRVSSFGYKIPFGVYNNSNNHAFVNFLLFTLVAIGVGHYEFISLRWPARVAAFMLVALMFLSVSRATIGSLVVWSFIVIFFRRAISRFTILTLVGLPALASLFLLAYQEFASSLLGSILGRFTEEATLGVRGTYVIESVDAISDSYGFGAGLGSNTEVLDNQDYHNFFMEVAVENGLLVFTILLMFLVSLLFRLFNGSLSRGNQGWKNRTLFAGLFALPIAAVGPSSIYGEVLFWAWLGILVGLVSKAKRENEFSIIRLSDEKS